MNYFISKTRRNLIIFIGLVLLTNSLNAQWSLFKSNKKEKYVQGPEKTWTQSELKDYDNWRNDILSKQAADDPQLLRRQKGVLNGNKITTEIWNYGSISSPNNKTTGYP